MTSDETERDERRDAAPAAHPTGAGGRPPLSRAPLERSWRGFGLHALHVFALSALFVAHPVLYLLGGSAEFFVARNAPPHEILSLLAVLVLGVPLAIVLLEAPAWLASRRGGQAAGAAVVFGLAGLGALGVLRSLPAPTPVVAALALAAAGLAAAAYALLPLARSFATATCPAIVLVPFWFVFLAPVSEVIFPGPPPTHAVTPRGQVPVVLVVFDELSLFSLLDERGEIHRERFPRVAALADHAHWFRNATASSDYTIVSVPAILSGRRPTVETAGALPTWRSHPDNLFTLLGGAYRIRHDQYSTALCPEALGEPTFAGRPSRWTDLPSDLLTLFGHAVLPEAVAAAHLPRIDTTWGGFADQGHLPDFAFGWKQGEGRDERADVALVQRARRAADADRLARFRDFIAAIEASPRRTVYYHHPLLPHAPYEYLPTGQRYAHPRDDNGAARRGDDMKLLDDWQARRSYVRSLLQLMLVDRLIGELVARLQAEGIYDETLLIVTADHGAAFRGGGYHRPASRSNRTEIAAVPLLVKLPGQREGIVSDRPVETIDILPTVADVLGVDVPWATDGRSLLAAEAARDRPRTLHSGPWRLEPDEALGFVPNRVQPLDGHLEAFWSTLAELTAELDDRRPGLEALYGGGPFAAVIGRDATALPAPRKSSFAVTLRGADRLRAVDPTADAVPCYLDGELSGAPDDARVGAAMVNGVVRALFALPPGGAGRFAAMLPPESLRAGANDVEVLLLGGSPEQPTVWRSAR